MERRHGILLVAFALAGAGFFYWLISRETRPAGEQTAAISHSVASPPPAASDPSLFDRIGGVLAKLRRNGANASDLAALRRELLANPAAGIAAIRQFLATGEDAATGQRFIVGPGGVMEGSPTLRLFLLDLLGQLSRTAGGGAGAEVAREILSKNESPDEWALALRNLAWDEPKSLPFLAAKMHEMLAYEPWTATPTSGMLEAFDVAVFARDASFVPTLSALAHGGNTALQRAATVALDRLAENSPLAVMQYLNANPATIADLPFVRADYFAKANLGDEQQRKAVEVYLDRTDVSVSEKIKFLHAIASPGSFVSDSLLSTSRPPENASARYAGIATATAEWIRKNRFPPLSDHVQWLLQRATLTE
ncbi:MAG: hypothetical protein ABIZ56_07300 [Chthoniobacteraceae bacterium]